VIIHYCFVYFGGRMKNFTIYIALIAATIALVSCAVVRDGENTFEPIDPSMEEIHAVEPEVTAVPPVSINSVEMPIELLTEAVTEPVTEPPFDHRTDVFAEEGISVSNSEFVIPQDKIDSFFEMASEYKFTYSFLAIDLNSDMAFGYNVDQTFDAGTTVQAAFALAILKDINEGNTSYADTVTYEEKHYVYGSTGFVSKSKIGTVFTVKDLLYNILVYSDTPAYYMLLDFYGYDEYNQMMSDLGCTHRLSDEERWGKISARDLSLVWVEIYRFKDTCREGEYLWECLTDNYYNEIDFALNDYMKKRGYESIAHKSGWTDYVFSDSGIVIDSEQPYITIVMTKTYTRTYLFLDTVLYIDNIMKLYWDWQENPTV